MGRNSINIKEMTTAILNVPTSCIRIPAAAMRPASDRHDAYAALRILDFRRFVTGNTLSTIGSQMLFLAMGWDVYQTTNSPTALGLTGFLQAFPIVLFAIPAGHLIDRYNRKKIVVINQILMAISTALIAIISLERANIADFGILHCANHVLFWIASFFHEKTSHFDAPYLPVVLTLLFLNGTARAVNQCAKQSLLPQLVSTGTFANAATWHSSTVQASTMIGPMVAGFMLALVPGTDAKLVWPFAMTCLLAALLQFVSIAFFGKTNPVRSPIDKPVLTVKGLAVGISFVWNTKIIMATITLDLLSVLLGGSVELLPLFSKDILHAGPAGLGWLRSAPAFGAVAMALMSAHLAPSKRAGRMLLVAVCGFGLATIAFGLSRNLYLSLVMLFAIGACDNISSVVRQTLVQLMTPDPMRGRVSAVKAVFSSTSNGLGALESGLAAALCGPTLAVVLGGLGTLVVVPMVAAVWPQLRRFGALHEAGGEPESIASSEQSLEMAAAAE